MPFGIVYCNRTSAPFLEILYVAGLFAKDKLVADIVGEEYKTTSDTFANALLFVLLIPCKSSFT